jgi:CubicO group peptidase (beta-lactamase class C family)
MWHLANAQSGGAPTLVASSYEEHSWRWRRDHPLDGTREVGVVLQGLDQTVGELLATHFPKDADPRLRAVTVQQLLTMTGGLPGDVQPTGGDPRLSRRLFRSRDWVGHILGWPLVATPGTTFAYSNASSHLLSVIVADATGQSTLAVARARLFGPLGIHSDNVFQPRAGKPPTPPRCRPTSRPLLPGHGTRRATTSASARPSCPPATWPSSATCTSTATAGTPPRWSRPTTCAPPPNPTAAQGAARGYGYQWWTRSVNLHPSFAADGIGGQRILVVPDLDLVVVVLTCDAQQQLEDAEELVGQTIIPAVTD